MGEIYLPTLNLGPFQIPNTQYIDLGEVKNIPSIIKSLILLHYPGSVAESVKESYKARDTVGHYLALRGEDDILYCYTMSKQWDNNYIQLLMTKGHEETHLAETLELLSHIEEKGKKFGLKFPLEYNLDPELIADIGGFICLLDHNIDPREHTNSNTVSLINKIFTLN